MKDSEGTEADVTASMALAEEANVPKNDVSDEKWTATKAAAENEGTQASPVTPATGPEAAATGSDSIGKKDSRVTTNLRIPRAQPITRPRKRLLMFEENPPLAQRKKEDEAKEKGEVKKD
ncbi:hypothetical protein NMY22_g20170 [Coprinellus aureogranulatus]|nr:hypothetical protein NMY22_g20170 [Coprinellus aureogranulatus]